jgi:hypothetical protein
MHPGAGSTNALFKESSAANNDKSGFYFCVRANHITVKACGFSRNANGISIGTRDCHNRIEQCRIEENVGPGVLVRNAPPPTEVHSCYVADCTLVGNAGVDGQGQVEVSSDAHDLVFAGNRIVQGAGVGNPDMYLETGADVTVLKESSAAGQPPFECGYGDWPEEIFRHL